VGRVEGRWPVVVAVMCGIGEGVAGGRGRGWCGGVSGGGHQKVGWRGRTGTGVVQVTVGAGRPSCPAVVGTVNQTGV